MTRNTCARPLAVLTALLCLWIPARSQGTDLTIKGELQSNTPRLFSEYMVELNDSIHRATPIKVDVHHDGTFQFRNVEPGEYSVVVTTLHGDFVHEQLVSISSTMRTMEVRLPDVTANPPGARTVSLKQLLHPPTKKAFRSFVEAQHFSESGDYVKAAAALERAVQESPDYADAHVNLGAQYVRMGKPEAAITELERALEISGPSPVLLCNLASAQARAGLRDRAVESARWALRLDRGSVPAHLILGAMLAADPRARDEAIGHLERAAGQYESAREILRRMR